MATISEERVREIVKEQIGLRTIDMRSTVRSYFAPGGDKIITYEYLREAVASLDEEITNLRWRIAKLERPWYKRIFS
jgi:hypothetical protein